MDCEQNDEQEGDSSEDEDENDEEEEEEEDETFDVKAIHGKKGKGKTLQYLVEWEGEWGDQQRTWEPAAFLAGNLVLEEWLKSS